MRGGKPKPTALKILQGNPGGRPLNQNEPKPPSGRPKMPNWISDRARKHWKLNAGTLFSKSLLTKFDSAAFAGMCECLAGLEESNEILKRDGPVILGQSGAPIKHPMANYKKDMLTLLRGYVSEFGLTPSSRSRVTISESETENPLRAFLGKKR